MSNGLNRYKVLVLPCSYVLSEASAEKIKTFAENGGAVIADYLLAEKRPGGVCYTSLPGGGLDEVFGVEREDIYPIDHESLYEENYLGITLNSVLEELCVTTASVSERYANGYAVVTENAFGKGRAIYLASQFFKGYLETPNKKQRDIIKKTLNSVGIFAPITLAETDKLDKNNVVTSNLFDRESDELNVLTVTNSDYGEVCDTIELKKSEYDVLGNCENIEIINRDDKTVVRFKLKSWQTFALINKG